MPLESMKLNWAKLLDIKKALKLWNDYGEGKHIIEGHSTNAIAHVRGRKKTPWTLYGFF